MGGVICNIDDKRKNQDLKEDDFNNNQEHLNFQKIENKNTKDFLMNLEIKKQKSNISNIVSMDTNLLVSKGTMNIKNNYKCIKILGKGSFGTVYLVRHKQLNTYFAMKIIKKVNNNDNDNDELLMNEINILRKMDHPHIVKINDFYNTCTEYILVTEYCPEGELFYEIKSLAPFNEALAGWYMKQILSAVCYCHKLKIIHRDLKPENILIYQKNKNGFNIIKIIDFGTAVFFNKNLIEKSITGSIYYISPEIISKEKNYTEKCDIWSCGVIMYILLTGQPPFNSSSDAKIAKKILEGKFDMEKYPWPIISDQAKDLVKKLLEIDDKKRISAEEALKHPWFESKEVKSENTENLFEVKNPNKLLNNLINYRSDNILRSAVFAYLVHNNIQLNFVHEAIKLFNKIDINGDGQISREEFSKGLQNYLKLSGKDLANKVDIIFNNIDTDHNGYIEYEEFIRAAIDKQYFLSDNFLKFAFDYFDRNKNGRINFNEIKQIFYQNDKNKSSKEAQNQLSKNFQELDINGDGVLTFDEFTEMARKIINNE